jgi:transcription-repair coupling factor (superfamily II helicase)
LQVLVAHGGLPPDEVDTTMVRFADGDGDVLLATNIIESGLDVPRANTMLVWRADRFGLAQLHQVRGRVGRGRAQGIAYLLTEPAAELAAATRKRLETLATLDRLGAGFALSARDLDIRGAGDLLGEEQAGHMKLIGAGLYRHLLQRALVIAQGEQPPEDWMPEVNIGATGSFPEAYVPEPDLRINLYARLFAAGTAREIDALADEIEDRFGPLPEAVSGLLARVRLGVLCRQAGVERLDAGPQGIALTFRPGALGKPGMEEAVAAMGDAAEFRGERLIVSRPSETAEERQGLAADLLEALS